jgi:hypothetical protein
MKVLKACRIVDNKEYENLENIVYFKDIEFEENTNKDKKPSSNPAGYPAGADL